MVIFLILGGFLLSTAKYTLPDDDNHKNVVITDRLCIDCHNKKFLKNNATIEFVVMNTGDSHSKKQNR